MIGSPFQELPVTAPQTKPGGGAEGTGDALSPKTGRKALAKTGANVKDAGIIATMLGAAGAALLAARRRMGGTADRAES